jgi:hypothetical protein
MDTYAIIIIKALEVGATVLFSTEENGECPPPERLDKGEVLLLSTPERYHAIRVRGHAQVYTPHHVVDAESGLVIGGRG